MPNSLVRLSIQQQRQCALPCSLHDVTVSVLQTGHIWKHWAPTSGSVTTIWRPAYQTEWPWTVIWRSHMAALTPILCFRNQSRLCYYSSAHNICTYSFKHCSASVLLSLQKQDRCVSLYQELDKPDQIYTTGSFQMFIPVFLLGRFKDVIVSQSWKIVFKSLCLCVMVCFYCGVRSYFSMNHMAVYNCVLPELGLFREFHPPHPSFTPPPCLIF